LRILSADTRDPDFFDIPKCVLQFKCSKWTKKNNETLCLNDDNEYKIK